MNVNELRAMRAKAWESAKNFLDSHRNENGMLSLEDTKKSNVRKRWMQWRGKWQCL